MMITLILLSILKANGYIIPVWCWIFAAIGLTTELVDAIQNNGIQSQ